MPMEHVKLDGSHGLEVALENLHRLIVPAYVNKQAAPGKARLILNLDARQIVAVAIAFHQLQQSLQTAQGPNHSRRHESRLFVRDFQAVALVLSNRWNSLSRPSRLDHESSSAFIRRQTSRQRQSNPPLQSFDDAVNP